MKLSEQQRQSIIDYLRTPDMPPATVPHTPADAWAASPYHRDEADERERERRLYETAADIQAAGLSAADPFGLPSAVVGAVSPETRDEWRETYNERPGAATAGAFIFPYGTAARGLQTMGGGLRQMLAAGGAAASGDAVDTMTGYRDGLGADTAQKAVGGALLPMFANNLRPTRLTAPVAGGAAFAHGMSPSTDGDLYSDYSE